MPYSNTSNYVKFIKGSQSAFDGLIKSNRVDNNTLYFITDGNELKLYLGSTLISSTEPKDEVLDLNSLSDVTLAEEIGANSVLTYDANSSQWKETSLEALAEMLNIPDEPAVMEGAVNSNVELNIIGKDSIAGLVPVAKDGQANFFLQGSGNWVNIEPVIESKAMAITQAAIGTLTEGADDAFDTLKEISDWILNDGTGAAVLVKEFGDFKSQVGDLSSLSENQTLAGLVATNAQTIETTQSNLNSLATKVGDLSTLDENQTLAGLATTTQNNLSNLTTKVGDLEASVGVLEDLLKDSEGGTIDLSSYVTKDIFATTVGSLEDINTIKLSNLKTEEKNSLIGAINELHDQLVWGEITINS